MDFGRLSHETSHKGRPDRWPTPIFHAFCLPWGAMKAASVLHLQRKASNLDSQALQSPKHAKTSILQVIFHIFLHEVEDP